MPSFEVRTPQRTYPAIVERGALSRIAAAIPPETGKIFAVTERGVWDLHGAAVRSALANRSVEVLFFPGGEIHKRFESAEALAEQVLQGGGDRSSVVVAFGGGIVCDVAGFVAAIFMRGIPVIQVPTTLLAQVDAAIGGKTGVNLASGKNLIGSFHQPLAVIIDPDVLTTLPEREYRAGLYEIVKCGVIGDAELFDVLARDREAVLARKPEVVERIIADAVRLKARVVTEDEREGGPRRILNFGHTFGHALEAETQYNRFLHGEAVAWGMTAAVRLALAAGILGGGDGREILGCIEAYGPIPSLEGLDAGRLAARMKSDKKTVHGRVHFVLPEGIGRVRVTSEITGAQALAAIEASLPQ